MPPEKMQELARRIAERPNRGRDVWLTPATALLVARVLSARATRPMRHRKDAICARRLPKLGRGNLNGRAARFSGEF